MFGFQRWSGFVLCVFVVFVLSACGSLTGVDRGMLTKAEEAELSRRDVFGDFGDRIKKQDGEFLKADEVVRNVVVVDGPNTSLTVKVNRCVSSIFFPALMSKTVTLMDVQHYLQVHGVRLVTGPELFGTDIFQKQEFTFAFDHPPNLCEIVDAMNVQAGGGVRLESGNTVIVSAYEKSVWHLPVISNNYSAEANLESGQSDTAQQLGGMHLKARDVNKVTLADAVEERLKELLPDKKSGYYLYDKNTGLLTIYAIPPVMTQVRDYLSSLAKSLGRMARVRVTIFEVGKEKNGERGMDWSYALRRSLISKPWEYGLRSKMGDIMFSSPITNDIVKDEMYGFGFASIEDASRFSTIFRILSKTNEVTVLESTDVILLNGHATILSRGRDVEYVSEVNKEVTSEAGLVSYSVEKEHIYSGVKLYLDGTVRETSVSLSLFLELQKLVRMETVTFPDYQLQNPTVDVRNQSVVLQIQDGETQAVAGVAGSIDIAGLNGFGFRPLDEVAGLKTREGRQTWIVVLVTPHIIHVKDVFYEVS